MYRFIYVPAGAEQSSRTTSFSFYGSDGQKAANSNTTEITVQVSITHVNRPPVAKSTSVRGDYDVITAYPFSVDVSDVDSQPNTLSITIVSLPDQSFAKLRVGTTDVALNDVIQYPFSDLNLITTTAYTSGSTTFTFSASDGQDTSKGFGVVTFAINSPVNHMPTASASPTYTAQRGQPLSIALGAQDDDFLEIFTYNINALSIGGSFTTDGGSTLTPPSFTITMPQDQNMYTTNAILKFTAPVLATGSNYLQVSFSVSDHMGASSNTVSITVGIAPNNPPIATAPGPITLFEEDRSAVFTLGGTDPDTVDADSLRVKLTSLPTMGTLYLDGVGPVTSLDATYSNPSFYVVGGPLQYGDDLLTFVVIDILGKYSSSPLLGSLPSRFLYTLVGKNHTHY